MTRILRDLRNDHNGEFRVQLRDLQESHLPPRRFRSERMEDRAMMKEISLALGAFASLDREGDEINKNVRKKFGSLSKKEPRTVHDPAPTPRYRFIKPLPRKAAVRTAAAPENQEKKKDYYIEGHRTPYVPRPDLAEKDQ